MEKPMFYSGIIVKYQKQIWWVKRRERKLQVNNQPDKAFANASHESKVKAQKELVETLKVQWKLLWIERFNDKVRAEGVSEKDYEILNVERGTVITATRDYKVLNFKEILEKHLIEDPDRFIQPNVNIGGWNQFVKTHIKTHKPQRKNWLTREAPNKLVTQQSNKSRRGWLHAT